VNTRESKDREYVSATMLIQGVLSRTIPGTSTGALGRTPWRVMVTNDRVGILRLRAATFRAALRSGGQGKGAWVTAHAGLQPEAAPLASLWIRVFHA
jgi:hypothetical protein